jgi:hypothetical protein
LHFPNANKLVYFSVDGVSQDASVAVQQDVQLQRMANFASVSLLRDVSGSLSQNRRVSLFVAGKHEVAHVLSARFFGFMNCPSCVS